ncbi:MAG: aminotransferase class V-fold PLP-dependent enzyme [Mariniblastus sp.]
MWARKRIDIGRREMVAGLRCCLFSRSSVGSRNIIARHFRLDNGGPIPLPVNSKRGDFGSNGFELDNFDPDSFESPECFLSVRSGFDLLLQTIKTTKSNSQTDLRSSDGSHARELQPEVIFSGLTIVDMPRIAEAHGFAVVAADIDPHTLSPSVEEIESRITPRTKLIVIAHLMGGLVDIGPIAQLAQKYGLMLIEDCAQAYVGNHFTGSNMADVSMFSFGTIKTNTALGGAVFFIRDPELKLKLGEAHQRWPIQPNRAYAKRILRIGVVKIASKWPVAALIRIAFRISGRNHDDMAASMTKSFPGDRFFEKIRQQPSPALLSVMARRILQFSSETIHVRSERGELLSQTILSHNDELIPIGYFTLSPTHWVFAVMLQNADQTADLLWKNGFDATNHSSLCAVTPSVPAHNPSSTSYSGKDSLSNPTVTSQASAIRGKMLFLPTDLLPEKQLIRMGTLVGKFGIPATITKAGPTEFPQHDSSEQHATGQRENRLLSRPE